MKRFAIYPILIFAGLAPLAVPAAAQNANPFGTSLQGAWHAQFTITTAPPFIPLGTQFPGLLVFHADGTMSAADNDLMDGAGHGVWGRSGNNEYLLTFHTFEFEPGKASIGAGKVRGHDGGFFRVDLHGPLAIGFHQPGWHPGLHRRGHLYGQADGVGSIAALSGEAWWQGPAG